MIRGGLGRAAMALVALAAVVAVVGAVEPGRDAPEAALADSAVGAPLETTALHRTAVAEFVDAAAAARGKGVYLLDRRGGVYTDGDAVYRGSLPERGVAADAAELVPTPSGGGYWIFDRDGGVHTFGDAPYLGSTAESRGPGAPVIAAATTSTGRGYVALDAVGGVHVFGDAHYLGSVPGLRNAGVPVGDAPAIDLAVAPAGNGYYVLDGAGGIFTFGDATFFGSIPGLRAGGTPIGTADVRDLVVSRDGGGYWLTDAVGGVFAFGHTQFYGSAPAMGRPFDLTATAVLPAGTGYWMMDGGGTLLGFGAASTPAPPVGGPYTLIEQNPDGSSVRFNPCRSISYVVHRGDGAPGNATSIVAEAFRRLSEATGITFVSHGTTDEVFSARMNRPRWNHPSYGAGPTPVLVSFEAPTRTNGLQAEDAGIAGRLAATNDVGQRVTVTAALVINTAQNLPPDFSNAGSVGAVLLHELGHTLGLDHVSDARQIMSGVLVRGNPGEYQGGDLAGLAAVGAPSGCVADPAPR